MELFDSKDIEKSIDTVISGEPYSSVQRSFQNALRGINSEPNKGLPLNRNTDTQGYIFFGRPKCNMRYDNLAADRRVAHLINSNPMSYPYMVRRLLDPDQFSNDNSSPLYDPKNPFIPFLSNLCLSADGFSDFAADTYDADEGLHKESYSMLDGSKHILNTWDLNTTFQNIDGDPVSLLMLTWLIYGLSVFEDSMRPYLYNMIEKRIDYYCAIYRFVTGADGTTINKMYKTRAYPYAVPIGAAANYSKENWMQTDTDIVSIPFKCVGLCFNDYIIAKEFNNLWAFTNSALVSKSGYVKLTPGERLLFNHESYPYIDYGDETGGRMQLNWYVEKSIYEEKVG
jgi:hypothetical protein